MKTRISAIIIDPLKNEHDYTTVQTYKLLGVKDNSIDLSVYETSDGILEKLHDNRGFDALLTIGENINFHNLNILSFEFRKKWVHLEKFDANRIASSIINILIGNIGRSNEDSQVFSIFTCAFNTTKEQVLRLYNSLLGQTYRNWNWWILDDSEEGKNCYFNEIEDPRIHIIKNVSNHGNIGYNKHLIASVADGDYLVEVDHDDELTSDCLYWLKKAFDTYNDCDFVYSYALEEVAGIPITYGNYFALGLGRYEEHFVNGKIYTIPVSADINCLSIRHIVGEPNHVRCWKKEFYNKIGGHNTELSVLDDMELLIRTFLNGKMCKIPRVLYIQHEGDTPGDRRNGSTTQGKRFDEIQRTGEYIRIKYDKQIHDYMINHNLPDPYWNETVQRSFIYFGPKEGTVNLNYTLNV